MQGQARETVVLQLCPISRTHDVARPPKSYVYVTPLKDKKKKKKTQIQALCSSVTACIHKRNFLRENCLHEQLKAYQDVGYVIRKGSRPTASSSYEWEPTRIRHRETRPTPSPVPKATQIFCIGRRKVFFFLVLQDVCQGHKSFFRRSRNGYQAMNQWLCMPPLRRLRSRCHPLRPGPARASRGPSPWSAPSGAAPAGAPGRR